MWKFHRQQTFLTKENLNRIVENHHLKLIQEISQSEHSHIFKVQNQSGKIQALKITQVPFESIPEDINKLIPPKIENPFFLEYYDTFFAEPDLICYLMEYCEGGSVVDIMNALSRALNEREIQSIVHLTLISLQFLHSNGIIHNDLKAGNILFTQNGQLKISDTCICYVLSCMDELQNQQQKTTLSWKAPEYFEDQKSRVLSTKSDIWSLGITILEMFQKIPPNSDADFNQLQVLYCTSLNLPSAPNKSSKLFQDFVKRLIVKEPSNRPNASELLNDPFIKQITIEQSENEIKDLANRFIIYMKEKISDESSNSSSEISDDDFNDPNEAEESSSSE